MVIFRGILVDGPKLRLYYSRHLFEGQSDPPRGVGV